MSPTNWISEVEYFVMAEQAERPLDYIDGIVRPRSDASQNHLKITSRLVAAFSAPFYNGPYETVAAALRVKAGTGTRYYYPDIILFHDDAEFDERAPDTLLTPILLVEIPSNSTQSIDRTEKLDAYRAIPSLRHYLLVDQNRVRVEHHHRSDQNQWIHDVYLWRRDEIPLDRLEISVPVEEIYRRLDVPEDFVLLPETPEN